MRIAYLIAGSIVAMFVIFNGPRLPWIPADPLGPIGLFRGFVHGMIGFSYQISWMLIAAAVYQFLLGILYWDMDTRESLRWQFTLEGLGTARLLWILSGVFFLLGIAYILYVLTNDSMLWPAGLASSLVSLLTCWLFWLAFPLYEQVGIDREEVGI